MFRSMSRHPSSPNVSTSCARSKRCAQRPSFKKGDVDKTNPAAIITLKKRKKIFLFFYFSFSTLFSVGSLNVIGFFDSLQEA